jgi:hypothetical protein
MEYHELTGYYTYRAFTDRPLPVGDFGTIKAEEAELFLVIHTDGGITGSLSRPPEPRAVAKSFIDIQGDVGKQGSKANIAFKGHGRPDTIIAHESYEYSCNVTKTWEDGIGQRLTLVGTVRRFPSPGSENEEEVGKIASFIAVKRDFVEPRDINEVAIIPSALLMLASKSHRLKHAVWHTIRLSQLWSRLGEERRQKIRNLGWGLERPPHKPGNILNLANGAGEDFLFMHRKMIAMVQDIYKSQNVPYIESWKSIPLPFEIKHFLINGKPQILRIDTLQYFYSEQEDPQNPGMRIYHLNIPASGNMVPPPYVVPSDDKEDDLGFLRSSKFIKSYEYFNGVMLRLERIFKDKTFLASISLGALGNLLEFEIHNQMHMRWSSVPLDPRTSKPSNRNDFDFGDGWNDPRYDYLGDFYSSHVNPLFWKLHGWVDDRIEDWFNAHEATHPGEIKRYEYKGVKWFKPGKWVQVLNPFYWPERQHHHDDEQEEIDVMLKVMEIIKSLLQPESVDAETFKSSASGLMSFMRDIRIDR